MVGLLRIGHVFPFPVKLHIGGFRQIGGSGAVLWLADQIK
jgi:hypothetical protein